MMCCRVFAFVLLLIFTACGVCSSLFPLFRATDGDAVSNIFYWYTETVKPGTDGSGTITVRHYNQDRVCSQNRIFFVVAAALSTAGAALGGVATLLAAMWVCGRRMCLHHFITWVTFLSFACFAVTVALIVFSFLEGTCKNDAAANTSAIQDMKPKYEFGVGFMLMCAAAGGMLISLLYVVCSYCCDNGTCCCSNNKDDLDYDDDVSERRRRLDSRTTSRHGSMSRRSSMSRQRTNSSMSRGSRHRRSRSASTHE